MKLTQNRLKECVRYNRRTGIFVRISGKFAGDLAGCMNGARYIQIAIDGVVYLAHRLAWLYVYGQFPRGNLDHKNTVRHDNRFRNLREATNQQNMFNRGVQKNNSTGYKGVHFEPRGNKFVAQTVLNDKNIHIGTFLTAEAASRAYKAFAKKNHGKFARL